MQAGVELAFVASTENGDPLFRDCLEVLRERGVTAFVASNHSYTHILVTRGEQPEATRVLKESERIRPAREDGAVVIEDDLNKLMATDPSQVVLLRMDEASEDLIAIRQLLMAQGLRPGMSASAGFADIIVRTQDLEAAIAMLRTKPRFAKLLDEQRK